MDVELQKYYENRLSMMSSKAWSDLIDDVQSMHTATNDLSACVDEKTLHFRRGELSIMRWIISLKDVSEEVYQQLKDENEATS